jgi:hypothetical protein
MKAGLKKSITMKVDLMNSLNKLMTNLKDINTKFDNEMPLGNFDIEQI